MRVWIKPPSPMEATNVESKDGDLSFKPLFYQPRGKANAGIIEVRRDDGSLVFLGMMIVSGRDGSVVIHPRTKPVQSALDGGNRSKKTS